MSREIILSMSLPSELQRRLPDGRGAVRRLTGGQDSLSAAQSRWRRVAAAGDARAIKRRQRSWLGRLILSSSHPSAVLWTRVRSCSVIVSLIVHGYSTVRGAMAKHRSMLFAAELVTSFVFVFDFVFRLWTCPERRNARGSAAATRLRWLFSGEAFLSALVCIPALADGTVSAFDVCVALPRSLMLFRTARWRSSVRTVQRVLCVNREILYTSLALVSLTILLSATMLYAACARDAACATSHGIVDLVTAADWTEPARDLAAAPHALAPL